MKGTSTHALILCVIAAMLQPGCGHDDSVQEDAITRNALQTDILFEDPLVSAPVPGWNSSPVRFEPAGENSAVYVLGSGEDEYEETPASIGDKNWETYRIEVEFRPGDGGWTGIDFHLQDYGERACNISVYCETGQDSVPFEAAGWWQERLVWKLYPYAQRQVHVEPGQWYHLRIDVGLTMANVYFDGDTKPCYTVYDLPFHHGGVRFMAYYCEAGFRNFKVTKIGADEVTPLLADPWETARAETVLRDWEAIDPMSLDQAEKQWGSGNFNNLNWTVASTDNRGVVDLTATFPDWQEEGAVFARTVIMAGQPKDQQFFLTYTDRLHIRVNGVDCFTGPPREWFHPERADHGYSRLIPDQYTVTVPLNTGENEILVRSEMREPLFGWGFWMRAE